MRYENGSQMAPILALLLVGVLAVVLSFVLAGVITAETDDDSTQSGKKLVIRSRGGGALGITKADLSRRPREAGGKPAPSRRSLPATFDPVPTILKLSFPTLVEPGEEVRGTVKFNDPDDYVFGIFITVFFPDGDVVTEPLYYYPDDGGDVFKGKYSFWVELPFSETPLTGKIIITASDEYLNVSEVSQKFALIY